MPYKDIEKARECARISARKMRKLHPEKHKLATRKSRKKHHVIYLEQKKRWYYKHRDEQLKIHKTKSKERRQIVLTHYGGNPPKCSCCGETILAFLTIEHLNGGGTKHRKAIGASNLMRNIINNNFPKEYDVLCYNCNCAKYHLGICPHSQ
jgi:hypothetical protein